MHIYCEVTVLTFDIGSYLVRELADELAEPRLHEHIAKFLYSQLNPYLDIPQDPEDPDLPEVSSRMRIGVHSSSIAVFYAPNERAGLHGMHREIIRCAPMWYRQFPRYDTVLVTENPNLWGMLRYRVARVRRFLSVLYDGILYPCALVQWFVTDVRGPDKATGMWKVQPDLVDGQRTTSIIALSSIFRACHLMPIFGRTFLPPDFHFSESLDAFKAYFVNSYVDYHAHEYII